MELVIKRYPTEALPLTFLDKDVISGVIKPPRLLNPISREAAPLLLMPLALLIFYLYMKGLAILLHSAGCLSWNERPDQDKCNDCN